MRSDLHLIAARPNPLELLDCNSSAKFLDFCTAQKLASGQRKQS